MSREKVLRDHNEIVIYSEEDWETLDAKRANAITLLDMLVTEGLKPFVYGSIARGNVHKNSDIDIIITQTVPSFQIEYILNKNGFESYHREIIMATPLDSIKLYIHLSDLESITIPLTKMDNKVSEFYDFGGKINLDQLHSELRVPGIDKRLVLIKPNTLGHEEISIIDNETTAAKEVGISINTIFERKKVLLRREKHGRTGVFLKRELQKDESPEDVLRKLASKKSIIRKKIFKT